MGYVLVINEKQAKKDSSSLNERAAKKLGKDSRFLRNGEVLEVNDYNIDGGWAELKGGNWVAIEDSPSCIYLGKDYVNTDN